MIIVEGPDGGGKSTLVRVLSSQLGLPVAPKVVGSDTRALVDLVSWTERNVEAGFQRTIFDRHRLISEPIYSPFKKDHPSPQFMDLGWLSDLTWRFYQLKPILIYALPGIELVKLNVMDPATDNSFVAEWIDHIYAGYVARASHDLSRGAARIYNYDTTRIDDIVEWVRRKLTDRITVNDAERVSSTQRPRLQLPAPREAADSSADRRVGRPSSLRNSD